MEMILAVIIVIGSVGAVAQGSELQESKCTDKVISAVTSQDSKMCRLTVRTRHHY